MKYDVFISYRRDLNKGEIGATLASLVRTYLQNAGLKVFMDTANLKAGEFPKQLEDAIANSSAVVLILSPNSLDDCLKEGDWVRREIETALQAKTPIVPVLHSEFHWPVRLPDSIGCIPNQNGVTWTHEYEDAASKKLLGFLGFASSNATLSDSDTKEAERLFREGRKHEDGAYERCDVIKAFEFYRAAAEKGHPDAQFEVGTAYNEGWGDRVHDIGFAIDWWKKAADGGSPDAMFALAELYKSGDGLEKDIAQSERLFKQAFSLWKVRADAGDSRAQRRLAYCYEGGIGTEMDCRLAMIWLEKAAKNNDVWALVEVGFYRADNYDDNEREQWRKKALATLSTLAKKGNPWCQHELSNFYSGLCGEEYKNSAEALKWLEKAVDQGANGAMWDLGVRYLKGEDVPVDFGKAYMFLFRAAQNGHKCALYEYGLCLLLGFAGYNEEDPNAKAIACFEACAKRFNPEERSGIAGAEESYELLEKFGERSMRSGKAVALALAKVECWAGLSSTHEENNHPDVAADDRSAAINVLSDSSLLFKGEDAAYASQLLCEYACMLDKDQANKAVKACNAALRIMGEREEARVMKGHALFLLALAYRNLKKLSLSLKTCQEALAICASGDANNVNDSIRMKCSFLLGTLQMDLGKYADAIKPYRDALSLRTKLEKDNRFRRWEYLPESEALEQTLAGINLRLAQCFSKVGNKPLAHNYALAALNESSRYPNDSDYRQLIRRCEEFQRQVRPFNFQDISTVSRSLNAKGQKGRILVKTGWYDVSKFSDMVAFDDENMILPLLLLPQEKPYRPVSMKQARDVRETEDCVDGQVVYPDLLVQLAGKSLDALYPNRKERKCRRRCLIVCGSSTLRMLKQTYWDEGREEKWLERQDVVFCSYEEVQTELGKCFNIEALNANSSEDVRYEVWIEGMSTDAWSQNARIIGEAFKSIKGKLNRTKAMFSYGKHLDVFDPDAQGVLVKNLTREEAFGIRTTLINNGFLASARPMDR